MSGSAGLAAFQALDDRASQLFDAAFEPLGLTTTPGSAPHLLLLVPDAEGDPRRLEISHHVVIDHHDTVPVWSLDPFVGWYRPDVERVRHDAVGRDEWASIVAPLSAFRPQGTLRSSRAWQTGSAAEADALTADIARTAAQAMPSWLEHFATSDSTIEYAKQWPVLRDVHHQQTGLIVSCLEGRTDDVEYFARFIFRRTARVMLRRGGYESKAAQYRAIGQVTGVEVPVPTLEQVQAWADEQERTRKY